MHPGQRLGAWELERKLGEGGMGEVWRAHRADDPATLSALKRIKGDVDRDLAQRFLREAAILADLDHPGVPALLDYQAQPLFLAMEFVEGVALDVLLEERGAVPVPDALELVRQVVDALAYLHARGVWHRDIKPANLILQSDGWVKLVDFGVARGDGYADLTAAGMLVGTLAYMPPEAFSGGEEDPQAWDLYGAGVVLAKLLTGESGFGTSASGTERPFEQARLKLERTHVDVGEALPDDIRELVRDMTWRDPARRITSPGALGRRLRTLLRAHPGADLARLAASEAPVLRVPTEAPPTGPTEVARTAPPTRERGGPPLLVLIGIGVAIGVAILAVLVVVLVVLGAAGAYLLGG